MAKMTKEHKILLAEAYNELVNELKKEMDEIEDEINTLEKTRLKKMISNDLAFYMNEIQDQEGYNKLAHETYTKTDELNKKLRKLQRKQYHLEQNKIKYE